MFTERQIQILRQLQDRAVGENKRLLQDVLRNDLAKGDIQAVCLIISDEFLLHGVRDDKYNPNDYGRELETLLDIVNRPRLQ